MPNHSLNSYSIDGESRKLVAALRGVIGLIERMPNAPAILQAAGGKVVLDAKSLLQELGEEV